MATNYLHSEMSQVLKVLIAQELAKAVSVLAQELSLQQKPKQRISRQTQRKAGGYSRSRQELEELTMKLFEVIEAHPGERMSSLANRLGKTVQELQFPAAKLRKSARIHVVGQWMHMRYYPGISSMDA